MENKQIYVPFVTNIISKLLAATFWSSVTSADSHFVSQCDQELRIRDDSYVKELKGQEEELALLIERMEDQIKTMTRAYREELAQLEVRLGL